MPTKKSEANATDALRLNELKWSKPLMAAGYTVIPNVIIENQRAIGLDALDLAIVMHLAMHWWYPENKPRPSKSTIAKALNLHPRTIQKRLASLEAAELIKRESRSSRENFYHLDGLIEAALPFAKERVRERKARLEAQKKRAGRRGRPVLVVANDD